MRPARPTNGDVRRQAAQGELQNAAARRLRRDIAELLAVPAFRRYAAHLVYGKCGVKKGHWHPNAEIHRTAARNDLGVEILTELAAVDPAGFIQLELEHVHRMAEELELAPSTTQGEDDAEAP